VLNNTPSTQVFLRSNETYRQIAQRLLMQSFSSRSKLTINIGSISQELEQQFPELANAAITLPLLGRQPTIYIAPEIPTLLLSKSSGSLLVIGESGRALAAATGQQLTKNKNLGLPTVADQSNLIIQPGQQALSSNDVEFIRLVVQQLQAQHLVLSSLVLPAAARELDVHFTNVGYMAKFNLQNEVKQQIGSFNAVRNYLAGQHINAQQYIDVRVEGRAYYQ